ncbi:MAG TPA: hypothetical protein VIM71_10880 [Lacunisphaera sp.]
MSPPLGLLFLLVVAAVILVSGYWLAALNLVDTFPERLALASIAGLASLLLLVAGVNFFLPLSGPGMGACLLPAMGSLLWSRSRSQLLADLRSAGRSRSGFMVLGLVAVFLTVLLGPALLDWQALFYDGTTNHDSYIWVTSGEFLQHHTYMESPVPSATQPWMNMAEDNVGWDPRRGQLGAETLLALFSSLAGTTPLFTCLYLAGSLFLPWTAAVYLAVTTFFRPQLSRATLAALVMLQPIFVFFYANSNLPNLLGTIMGTTVILATEHALRAGTRPRRLGWCAVLVMGFHGLLAVYPEMVPFILLSCGLLWLRPWWARRRDVVRTHAGWVAAAFVAGTVVNPAITVRAVRGFLYSFRTARTEDIFGNLFAPLNFAEYIPGSATLSIPAALSLGAVLGTGLTLMLLAAAITAWWRARDRLGALFALAGSGVLLVYTLVTGFKYGWQKSVQFSGIFITATMTAALVGAQIDEWHQTGWRRRTAGVCLAGIITFYTAATASNFSQIYEWRRQKILSRDWTALRELSATTLREQPVLVESATFRMPFFHSMWAAYFLPDSRTYYARRGGEGGGYLRLGVRDESAVPGGRPAALLVGRRWAESFDANSPRLLEGREFILLREANRVTDLQGVYPTNGYPDHAGGAMRFEILPHSRSRLLLELTPRTKRVTLPANWNLIRQTEGALDFSATVSGLPPWRLEIPLIARTSNRITVDLKEYDGPREDMAFVLRTVRIEDSP